MISNFVHIVESAVDAKGNDKITLGMYYFGGSDDGSMKTGSQSVKDDNDDTFKFYFGTKDNATTGEAKGVVLPVIRTTNYTSRVILLRLTTINTSQ